MYFKAQFQVLDLKCALFTFIKQIASIYIWMPRLMKYKLKYMLCNDTIVPVGGSMAPGLENLPSIHRKRDQDTDLEHLGVICG